MGSLVVPAVGAGAHPAKPKPGSPGYIQRDIENMMDAYGRQTGPHGQLTPGYLADVPGATNPATSSRSHSRHRTRPGRCSIQDSGSPDGTRAMRGAGRGPARAASRSPSRTRTATAR